MQRRVNDNCVVNQPLIREFVSERKRETEVQVDNVLFYLHKLALFIP